MRNARSTICPRCRVERIADEDRPPPTQTVAESSERPSGAVLDATPSEHLTFLLTATGKPYGDNHFSESFREWCDAAGLPKRCSAHGLRKAACRRDAENGCSGNEIMAHSGHGSMKELIRYTKAADQARLARNALAKAIIR